MTSIHIGDNGPAKCDATVRACPIGGQHFENWAEAGEAFDRKMKAEVNHLGGAKKVPTAEQKLDAKYELLEDRYLERVNEIESLDNVPFDSRGSLHDAIREEIVGEMEGFKKEMDEIRPPSPKATPDPIDVAKDIGAWVNTPKPKVVKTDKPYTDFDYVDPKDSKVIVPPKEASNDGYMGGRNWIGGKVPDQYQTQKEAAKAIRGDIAAAIKAGELPKDLKFGVKGNTGAWVSSITITVGLKDGAKGVPYPKSNDGYRADYGTPAQEEAFTKVSKYLSALGNQYSTDNSNASVDYFNSHNHVSVDRKTEWN